MAFCSRCGAELAANAKFCHKCGAAVLTASPPAPSVTTAAPAAPAGPADLHRVLKVSGKPRIVVRQWVPGNVEVKSGAAGEVTVDIEPKPPESVVWSVSQDGDLITVKFRIREFVDWPGHLLSGSPRTNIHVVVPSESDLDIRSRVDRVSVTGVSGSIMVESSAGVVSMQNCTGTIHARTRAGEIGLSGVKGTVSAETSAGQITFSGSLSTGYNRFRTRVGEIKLTLQGAQDLRVEGYATVGKVAVSPELEGEHYDGREYVGKIGAGTGRLVVETTAGSITIKH